jgi:hypothetical protein
MARFMERALTARRLVEQDSQAAVFRADGSIDETVLSSVQAGQ